MYHFQKIITYQLKTYKIRTYKDLEIEIEKKKLTLSNIHCATNCGSPQYDQEMKW